MLTRRGLFRGIAGLLGAAAAVPFATGRARSVGGGYIVERVGRIVPIGPESWVPTMTWNGTDANAEPTAAEDKAHRIAVEEARRLVQGLPSVFSRLTARPIA